MLPFSGRPVKDFASSSCKDAEVAGKYVTHLVLKVRDARASAERAEPPPI
jgi:hypothetical protein